MAKVKIYTNRIIDNIQKMNEYMEKYNRSWTLVTKVLAGHEPSLKKIIHPDVIQGTHSIADSRISSLKTIKKMNKDLVTMYLKPPAKSYVKNVVKYADISLNSDYDTIHLLDKEAKTQKKKHDIIIMIELGELREGVIRENFIEFFEKVFNLNHVNVIGLGTNLGCMYGIEPTFDKLIQLCLYEQLIETKFNLNIELVSGGSSITLPLLKKGKVPKGVNHLRIGEAVFLGTSPLTNKPFNKLSNNSFEFLSNIVELEKKDVHPDGVIGNGNVGHAELPTDEESMNGLEKEYKALLDFGVIDVNTDNITPKDNHISFLGTTSDLTVYRVGKNHERYAKTKQITFQPNYMAVAQLMNSKFIAKEVV